MEFAKGGLISESAGIPLRLSDGYRIIDPAVEEKYGREILDKLNAMTISDVSIKEGK